MTYERKTSKKNLSKIIIIIINNLCYFKQCKSWTPFDITGTSGRHCPTLAGRTTIIKVIRLSFIYFSFLFIYYFLSIRNTFFFEVIIDCDQQMANDIKVFKSKSVNCTNTYPITFNLVWIWSLLVVC